MVTKIFSLDKVSNSNLFFLLEKKTDLNNLSFLKLTKAIKDDIFEKIEKKKNGFFEYFLGKNDFKKLFIYVFSDQKGKNLDYLLGKEIGKLPNNFTILTNNSQNVETLLNHSILGRYKFEEYKKTKSQDKIFFLVDKQTEKIFDDRLGTIENIIFARNLGNTPSNELYPETFAELIKKTKFKNTKITVFDYEKIKKLGLGLLEAVGKGSSKKPYMVIFERIIDKKFPTIGLVGKGVTFDTGGIQVKPGDFMYEMKGDMCGAGSVFSIMKELDQKDLKVNIVACVVLAENHISGDSYKPSDILKSYSGQTVDVIHTDAEGRLVLADGISYISKNYKLDKIISIATLTGACMIALGFRYAGIMGNDEKLIQKFLDYSEKNIEKYNKLPFDDYFIDQTKSEIADLQNLSTGVKAGSTMGAAFLVNFCLNSEKYTHLDIAGTALNSYEPYAYVNKGMTGFGVDSVSFILKNL
ncbi:hypothetical protein BKN14_03830 [Candidatus Gracilibacteria bacterium HOT-871]|nr:hypothetical protein BKN14_03830 [Candidatus Gracilibacteria bacterium HOT-871]